MGDSQMAVFGLVPKSPICYVLLYLCFRIFFLETLKSLLVVLYRNGKIFLQHHSWRLTNSRHISSVTFRFDVLKLWSFSSSRETPEKLIQGYSQQNMYSLLLCVLYSTLIPQILNPYFTLARCITKSNMKCVLWNW